MPAPGVPEEQHLDTERLARPDIRALLAVLSTASQLQMRGQADLRRMGSPLKIHEFDVLVAVVAHGPLRPSDITRKASLAPNPTTVSSIVSRLEKRGLVTRQSHRTSVAVSSWKLPSAVRRCSISSSPRWSGRSSAGFGATSAMKNSLRSPRFSNAYDS